MTETYCRACGQDVHITHSDEDCPTGEANVRTPVELRASVIERECTEGEGEPA